MRNRMSKGLPLHRVVDLCLLMAKVTFGSCRTSTGPYNGPVLRSRLDETLIGAPESFHTTAV
jgi:hypothetical protein